MDRSNIAVATITAAVGWFVHRHLAEKARKYYTLRHTNEMREQHSEAFRAGWDQATDHCVRWMSASDYELMTGNPHPYKS